MNRKDCETTKDVSSETCLYSKELDSYTAKEFKAIGDMLVEAERFNLQVEVIWSALHGINDDTKDIEKACDNALNQWDL